MSDNGRKDPMDESCVILIDWKAGESSNGVGMTRDEEERTKCI